VNWIINQYIKDPHDDLEQEDFTEGLVEDIMTALSRFEDDAAAAGVRLPGGTGRSGIGMVQGGLDAVVGLVATPAPGSSSHGGRCEAFKKLSLKGIWMEQASPRGMPRHRRGI
jgi:hypothetical protein